jgi:hypothetical protein
LTESRHSPAGECGFACRAAAEGATAPETLRPTDRWDGLLKGKPMSLWKAVLPSRHHPPTE